MTERAGVRANPVTPPATPAPEPRPPSADHADRAAAPVAIEAAHVRWHNQQGPDEIANALALCALHHALFDLGVLGITEDRRIRVSTLYVARNEAGMAVDALVGKPLLIPRPHQPAVDIVHISWHHHQVFKGALRRHGLGSGRWSHGIRSSRLMCGKR